MGRWHAQKELTPPWTPGHAQSPNSCNTTGLALLDHSLLCIPDALGQTATALQKQTNKTHLLHAVMLHAWLDGLSQDATSYDLHLDTIHILCIQAESRKVICNKGIVSIYRMH